jgi:hypothetical protein
MNKSAAPARKKSRREKQEYRDAVARRLDGLFSALQEDLIDKDPICPCKAFAVQRQLQRMRKRAGYIKPELTKIAEAAFLATNDLVSKTSVTLSPQIIVEAARFIEYALERFTTSLDESNIQQSLDPSYLYDNWRFGPGASYGVTGTHAAAKIMQPMTCTRLSEPFVSSLRACNPYFQSFDARNGNSGTHLVKGSRLGTVSKNEDTMRTICTEPSGNMAMQLAAGRYLEGVLRMIGLDIREQQPKNQVLARIGSICGSIATIDLKSASDMYQLYLIRMTYPARWYKLLTALRSEYTEVNGKWVKLNMISTMGNGFTFPMMTLLNAALIYAYRRLNGGPNLYLDLSRTAVFGDDIIVPVNEYDLCCSTLSSAGLLVNHEKSYHEGDFRESCGGDYFRGVDVTPFYVQSLDSRSDVYVAINQVLEWGGRHNLLLHRTLAYLRTLIAGPLFFVPEWHSPDSGVLTQRVSHRYQYLEAVAEKVDCKSNPFELPLAAGGYLRGDTYGGVPHSFYMVRPDRNSQMRYRVRKSRLPNGYPDGRCPVSRPDHVSNFILSILFLLD